MKVRMPGMVLISIFYLLLALPSMSMENRPGSGNSGAGITPVAAGDALVVPAGNAPLSPSLKNDSGIEFVWELDPYYTEVSLHFPLTDTPIPEMTGANEFAVYRKLFVDSLIPRYMLVEAAVFPMPLIGL